MRLSALVIAAGLVANGPWAAGASHTSQPATARRPNVLLIVFDDMNDWVLHPAEHPRAITPNIDRLRATSVCFSEAHVAVPVCGPSRKCLLAGLYPQTTDDYGFAPWQTVKSLEGCVPLPLHFRQSGYESYGTGKLLHEGAGGDFYTAYGIGPDYGPWPWQGKGQPLNTPHPLQYEAWIDHLPVQMHRDTNYGPLSAVPDWKANPALGIPGAQGWYGEDGKPFRYATDEDRQRMPDEVSADWAIEILSRQHPRPFYLAVGFVRPHSPLYVPKKYFDMFPLDGIELPPYLANDLADCASALRNRWEWGFLKYRALMAAGGTQTWKEWVQAYLAALAFADEQLGKLLTALEASGRADDTIVLVTADNGYHIGEKDCIQKWHLWDESTRVPLLIRVPHSSANGKVCLHPVSLVDVYPTLAELCGLSQEPNAEGSKRPLDGHSLVPFLGDPENGAWDGPSVALTAVRDGRDAPHFSVRSERYRYTLCANGEEELYDHQADPHEWTNLAAQPQHAAEKARLRREMMTIFEATTMPWQKAM